MIQAHRGAAASPVARGDRPMRIVLACVGFSENMGYAENCLPAALARQGAEVHVVASLGGVYEGTSLFRSSRGFYESSVDKVPVKEVEGFTLHRIRFVPTFGYLRPIGLREKLEVLKPDIFQSFYPVGWLPTIAVRLKFSIKYRLFTETHMHASVFPLAQTAGRCWSSAFLRNFFSRYCNGRLISWASEKCYAISPDCARIAIEFFGYEPAKVVLAPLGVNTDLFHPPASAAEHQKRLIKRVELGLSEKQIVCIYIGRFSTEKNPLLLAQAVERLRDAGKPYCGVFIGAGEQQEALAGTPGCVVRPFVPHRDLPAYYWAADIGVWPTQESTSMLDAAACGLPLVVNHTMGDMDRIKNNGIAFNLNSVGDLAGALASLQESSYRLNLGKVGAKKVTTLYSWSEIARRRMVDYDAAMRGCYSAPEFV